MEQEQSRWQVLPDKFFSLLWKQKLGLKNTIFICIDMNKNLSESEALCPGKLGS